MDVIAAHQFGFSNTVATSGTALTSEHLRVIKRYTEKVAFSFDADNAGIKALKNAAFISWDAGINPLVISILFGKDPDECMRKDPKLWESAVIEAKPIVDFFIDLEMSKYNNRQLTTAQKKNVSSEIISFIVAMPSAIEQSEYIRKLANVLNVPDASIQQEMKMFKLGKYSKEATGDLLPTKQVVNVENPELDLEKKIIGLIIRYQIYQ